MISHGFEISIAGGVEEMVRDPNSCLFFSFFLNDVLCLLSRDNDRVQR